MSIGAKCDLCGIPMGATETFNVFRVWNGIRIVQIEDVGLQGVPYGDNLIVCHECMGKAYDLLLNIKEVTK